MCIIRVGTAYCFTVSLIWYIFCWNGSFPWELSKVWNARFPSDKSGWGPLLHVDPSCSVSMFFCKNAPEKPSSFTLDLFCLCRMIRWCCSALHLFLRNRSSCVCHVKDLGIVCVSLRPPRTLRYQKDTALNGFYLISLRIVIVAIHQVYWLSCVSECPSRPGYLLLHFGAVPLCAGVTGDAVQLFCGWGRTELRGGNAFCFRIVTYIWYNKQMHLSCIVHSTTEIHFVSFLTWRHMLLHSPTCQP